MLHRSNVLGGHTVQPFLEHKEDKQIPFSTHDVHIHVILECGLAVERKEAH